MRLSNGRPKKKKIIRNFSWTKSVMLGERPINVPTFHITRDKTNNLPTFSISSFNSHFIRIKKSKPSPLSKTYSHRRTARKPYNSNDPSIHTQHGLSQRDSHSIVSFCMAALSVGCLRVSSVKHSDIHNFTKLYKNHVYLQYKTKEIWKPIEFCPFFRWIKPKTIWIQNGSGKYNDMVSLNNEIMWI